MIESSIAIVERYAAIESLMDLDGGSGKAEASGAADEFAAGDRPIGQRCRY